jgi:predicted alpha/beta superfamily hydrolase
MKFRRTPIARMCWIVCGLLVGFAALADIVPAEGEPIVIAHRYKLESKLMGETRTYIVHKPPEYDFSNERYGVVVLLDGDANIQHVTATADDLTRNGRAMPMLIVGIENTDRQRDLTPPMSHRENRPEGAVGGAGKFLSFIADELLPEIDRNYRTRSTRILIGHSYGGLFAIYSLLNRPDLFKAYIAVSPSLWWDEQALAKQAEQFVIDHKDLQGAVFMTMGNEGGPTLGGAEKVAGSLTSIPGFGVEFKRWPEETHGSVVMRSVYEGMKWLNEFYYIHEPFRIYDEAGLQFFDKRFERISKHLGLEVKIPEHVLMEIQTILVHEKRYADAVPVLERVLQLYPQRTGPHYELGRVSVATGDKSRAEAEFKQTLALDPGHAGARAELEKLGIDPKSVVTETRVAPSVLRRYVGEYRYSDETLVVTLEDGKLFIRVRNDKRELLARSNNNFFAIDSGRQYTFNKKSGRTSSLTVQSPEFTYESRKVK